MNEMSQFRDTSTEDVAQAKPVDLRDVARFFRFAKMRVLSFVLVFTLLGAIYAILVPTSYTATASVIFDPTSSPEFLKGGSWLESRLETTMRIDSQAELLKSPQIATSVIDALHLAKEPELQTNVGLFRRLLNLLMVPPPEPVGPLPTAEKAPNSPIVEQSAVAPFLERLSVRRVSLSSVIEVSFHANTADKATRIVNQIVRSYIDKDVEDKAAAARQGTLWLEERLAELRKTSTEARLTLERFKAVGAGSASDSIVKLAELESISNSYRRLYETFLLKQVEAVQKISYPVADARIVSLASSLRAKPYPDAKLIVMFAVFLGASLGTGVALVQYSLRSIDRLKVGTSGLTRLASIEVMNRANRRLDDTFHIHGDFAALRSAINLRCPPQQRRIGLISLTEGCGGSLVAVKLAQHFAFSGANTLLIDANMNAPEISRTLAPLATWGLADMLRETEEQAAAGPPYLTEMMANLAILSAGTRNSVDTFGDMYGANNGAAQRLAELCADFDVCIVDVTPVAASSDALFMAPLLDANVLIADAGASTSDELRMAYKSLSNVDAKVLGVIVNKAPRDAA